VVLGLLLVVAGEQERGSGLCHHPRGVDAGTAFVIKGRVHRSSVLLRFVM
jgi:hypothetical protein